MDTRLVVARRQGWGWVQLQRGNRRGSICGDGAMLCLDCGGGYTNPYMG